MNYIGVSVPVGRLACSTDESARRCRRQVRHRRTAADRMAESADSQYSRSGVDEAIQRLRAQVSIARRARCCAGPWPAPVIAAAAMRRQIQSPMRSNLRLLLDARFKIVQPVNLHVTGCPHSCAQHYIGDIGLLGTKVREEGYQVVIGGGSDQDEGLARELISSISFSDLATGTLRAFRRIHRGPATHG